MKLLYITVSTALVLTAALFIQQTADEGTVACPDVMIYGTAGTGAGGSASPPAELVTDLVQARGLTVELEANPYPGSQNSDQDYLRSVGMGQANLLAFVKNFQQRCGTSTLLLVGFSQGAHVTHEALTRLDSAQNVHALLIADPIRNGRDPSIRDHILGDGPVGQYGDFLVRNDYTPIPLPSRLSGLTLSICHVNDVVCNPEGEYKSGAHLGSFTEAKPRIAAWVEEVLA